MTNLVDLTSGTVLTHTPAYPTNLAGDPNILNNSTVPTARINTLADALNACAAGGSGCSDLFSAATPPSGTAPGDTLQAILNIAQNPGSNVGMVFNVASESPNIPFTPNLLAASNAPNDWTLALTFTGGGLGFAPSVPLVVTDSPSGDPAKFLNTALAVDATGNVWVTGFALDLTTPAGSTTVAPDTNSGMIAEFNNLGAPQTKPSSVTAGNPLVVTFGGYIPIKHGGGNGGTVAPHSIALDPSGNVWVLGGNGIVSSGATNTPAEMSKIGPGLSPVLSSIPVGALAQYPIAIDGVGNVWLMDGGGLLEEFNNSGAMTLSNQGAIDSLGIPSYQGAQSFTLDSNAASLWGSGPDGFGDLFQANPVDGSDTTDYYWTASGVYTPLVAGPAGPNNAPGNVYGCGDAPAKPSMFTT